MEVTKNPKKVKAGKRGYQAQMLELKEEILANTGTTGSNPTSKPVVPLVVY